MVSEGKGEFFPSFVFFLSFNSGLKMKEKQKLQSPHQHLVQRLGVEQDLAQFGRAVADPDAEGVGVELVGVGGVWKWREERSGLSFFAVDVDFFEALSPSI